METNIDWHGMPHTELEARKSEVPEMPAQRMLQCNDGTYAHVHFSGNYGVGCGGFQDHDAYNIDENEAHQMAWSLFGLCGHTITYYDSAGCVVKRE